MSISRHRLLIPLAFAAFISLGLPDGVLGVAWPSIRRALSVPLDRLGLLLITSSIGYLTVSAFSGEIVRRIGVGKLLVASNILVVISLVGFADAPNWWLFVALGLFSGLGAGAIDAGMNAFAATHFSPRVTTWLHASYGIGATIGPASMTTVLAAGLSWRVGYSILAAALSIMAILFLMTLRIWDDNRSQSTVPAEEPVTARDTLRQPLVWLHIVLFFLYTGLEVTAGQWLYSIFVESRGINATFAGLCITAFWGSLTLGRITFGLLAPRYSPTAIVRFATILAPLAAIALALRPGPWLTGLACAVLGFALAPIYPMLISITPARLGKAVAHHAVGFQVCAAYVGIATLPSIAGILARRVGLESICVFMIATGALLLLVHEFVIRASRTMPAARIQPGIEVG